MAADLATLENRVSGVPDVSELEKKYARIEENLKDPATQLQQIKDAKDGRLNKPVELRKVIEREEQLFEEISRPLSEAIRQFGAWRNAWQAEKQRRITSYNVCYTKLLRPGVFAEAH